MAKETNEQTTPNAGATPAPPNPSKRASQAVVNVVLADGTRADAKVLRAEGLTRDVQIVSGRFAGTVITSSPHDPDGKTPDSWHNEYQI